MVTAVATVYQIVTGRNRDELRKLLGQGYRRVLTSDRHKVYDHLDEERHQLCWSHLRRDFQAMVDRGNAGSEIGKELLELSGQMLGWWKRVRDGTLTKVRFAGRTLNLSCPNSPKPPTCSAAATSSGGTAAGSFVCKVLS
jgi:transposase